MAAARIHQHAPAVFDADAFKVYRVGHRLSSEVVGDLAEARPSHFHMPSIAVNDDDARALIAKLIELRNALIDASKQTTSPRNAYFVSNLFFRISR